MFHAKSLMLPAWAAVRLLACAAAPLALHAVAAPPPAHAQESVSIELFHEELAPYGRWVDHPRHGFVWYPTEIDDGWRPYTRGHWANTEEHGWLWVSDEEWGWATYHYGRWALDRENTWYWVPGSDWGPAWVDWRYGDGHIGWAPLGPEVRWRGDSFDYGSADYGSRSYQPYWIFVRDEHFLSPGIHRHCAPPGRNAVFIQRSRPSTSYVRVGGGIVNRSLSINYVGEATRRPVPVVRIQAVGRPSDLSRGGGRDRPASTSISIFKPRVSIDPKATPRLGAPGPGREGEPRDSRGTGSRPSRGGDFGAGEQRARLPGGPGAQPQPQPVPAPAPRTNDRPGWSDQSRDGRRTPGEDPGRERQPGQSGSGSRGQPPAQQQVQPTPRINEGAPRINEAPRANPQPPQESRGGGQRGGGSDGSRQRQQDGQQGGGQQGGGQSQGAPSPQRTQGQPQQQQGKKPIDPNQPSGPGGGQGGGAGGGQGR
jgi:hypothetical protein